MESHPSCMVQANGEALPLEDVAIEATLRDLIAEVSVTQVYRNDDKTNIEAVYTFPLPLDAVLLGFEVTIGERVLRGTVVGKKDAEERYENAIGDGDAAVMLEQAEPGLYTMNVGNVMPGERVKVCLRYGVVLRWSGDAVRFFMPTTVAPRYGASPLAPHQVPESAITVENRFGLKVRIEGLLRNARVECPSHAVVYRDTDDAALVELDAERAVMDRDFVLMLSAQGVERSYAIADRDPAGHVVLVSFQPMIGGLAKPEPRSVKIVVDCSGSMAGDSIAQAKRALSSIVELLRPADQFNIIAFGSDSSALFKKQAACTPANLERARRFCSELDATLGGTEIGGALERAYASGSKGEMPEDVLLITDGEVGQWQQVVERAVASKHRVFTVGVGSSVAEAFVRTLAERTGGVCELVSPNEDMAGRITRHFQRMSATRSTNARITWPGGAVERWPKDLRHVYEGDTVIAWARYAKKPKGEVAFELEASDRAVRQTAQIRFEPDREQATSTLARLAAAMRLPELDAKRGVKEAIAYELVSRWTNYLVVLERAESEKATRLPALRKVQQTLAAGWGGMGGVVSRHVASIACFEETQALYDLASCCRSAPPPLGAVHARSMMPAFQAPSMDQVSEPLPELIVRLNSAPDRIHANITVAELHGMGAPDSICGEIWSEVTSGKDEAEAVLRFLESVAQGPFGDAMSNEVKRAIRTALREIAHYRGARLMPGG